MMKRKLERKAAPTPPPKSTRRQDPVSCESCRKKKLKCDRRLPCRSCTVRNLACSYGTYGPVGSPNVRENIETGNSPVSPSSMSQTLSKQAENQPRNDPLTTADWLETIVMGHRVPSAIPTTLRDGLTQKRGNPSQPGQTIVSGNLLTLIRGGVLPSLENPARIRLFSLLPSESEALSSLSYYLNHLDYQYHLIVAHRTERNILNIYENIANDKPVNLGHVALLFSIIACGLFYQLLPTESTDVAERSSGEAAFLAGSALIQANYVAYPTLEGLQATMIISHHLSFLTFNPVVSSFFIHGSLINQAQSLGLHVLDGASQVEDRKANGYDRAEVELKRRLWWDLASYDW